MPASNPAEGVGSGLRTVTVDLEAKAAEAWDDVADLKEARADVVAEAKEAAAENDTDGDGYTALDPEDRTRFEQAVEEFNERIENLAATADTLEHYVDAWDGGEFTLKEPSADELAYTVDETRAASLDIDYDTGDVEGTPREMYAQKLALSNGIIDRPAGAPEDVGELPGRVMQLLYEELDSIGAPDGSELGNTSLRAAMDEE